MTLLVASVTVLLVAGTASSLVVPQTVITSFRSQDELGSYHFGYSGGPTSRVEQRDAHGVVRGAYNYITDDGVVHKVEYIADSDGYRLISGTDIPVAPVAPAVVALEQVQETPEVRQAREEFEVAFRAAVALSA